MQSTAGKLLYYYKDPYCKVPIFISGEAKRCVLWIGGQQESFFTICYFQELAEKLGGSWAFAQTELPSGHIAYGAQDHRSDTEDVDDILLMLKKDYGMEEITLFATSTGVQVALQLLATGNNTEVVTRVILHGIVCRLDNPFFTEVAIAKRNERVKQMMADGRREDSRSMIGFYDIPVTPARLCEGGFLTMQEALWLPALNGDAATAKEALKAIKVPCFIMIATDSQYKPSKEDVEKVRQCATEAVGCPAADIQVEVFNDTCDEVRRLLKADIPAHVAAITKFLKKEDEKRAVKEAEEQALREEEEKRKRIALSKLM